MLKVLFVCIHNSARSQLAEELLRKMAPGSFDIESAGIEPGKINPLAIEVLAEIGIDIRNKKTNSVQSKFDQGKVYDYVITVCDETNAERCPVFTGIKKQLHWSFKDPSRFEGTWEEKIERTRKIRDQIKKNLLTWLDELNIKENEEFQTKII